MVIWVIKKGFKVFGGFFSYEMTVFKYRIQFAGFVLNTILMEVKRLESNGLAWFKTAVI